MSTSDIKFIVPGSPSFVHSTHHHHLTCVQTPLPPHLCTHTPPPAHSYTQTGLNRFTHLHIPPHTSTHIHTPPTYQRFSYKIQRFVMICILRTFLVLISWAVAVGIPRFEICLALVGGLATTILAFILPPLFHLVLKWRYTAIWRRLFHLAILVFGIAATGIATGVNLYQAIEHPGANTNCTQLEAQCDVVNTTSTQHCTGY